MTTKIQLPPELECLRCRHKWIPHIETVRICPKCKSAYWDTPKKTRAVAKSKPLLVRKRERTTV